MTTAERIATSFAVLDLEWEESAALKQVGVQTSYIGDELNNAGYIVGGTTAIATGLKPDDDFFNRAHPLEPRVLKVAFGSPLFVSLEIGREVAASIGALSFLIYGLKRAWGVDLELKAHREEMRERFFEAKRRASDAQSRMDTAQALMDQAKHEEEAVKISEQQGWGQDATFAPDGMRKRWDARRATLRVDDD